MAQADQVGVGALREKSPNLPALMPAVDKLPAEPEAQRIRRPTSPQFITACLSPLPSASFRDSAS